VERSLLPRAPWPASPLDRRRRPPSRVRRASLAMCFVHACRGEYRVTPIVMARPLAQDRLTPQPSVRSILPRTWAACSGPRPARLATLNPGQAPARRTRIHGRLRALASCPWLLASNARGQSRLFWAPFEYALRVRAWHPGTPAACRPPSFASCLTTRTSQLSVCRSTARPRQPPASRLPAGPRALTNEC
jgi:hypothetical protein